MNILIVSQHYWPENFRITDIAESLVFEGNEVTVLCGLPNYPEGFIFEGYKHGQNRIQKHNGVNIIRANEIGRRKNLLFRVLNYWSYPFYASRVAKKLGGEYDVVLVNGLSPIMTAIPAIKYAKKHDKPLIMYEMDLWPESLLAGGVKKGSWIYNHYKKVSSRIYSQFDRILVSTKEHIPYIKTLPGCANLDIEYLPQYAETLFEENDLSCEPHDTIDLMFAGNIGKAQSIGTIIEAAALLKGHKRFKFHIVGSGSELDSAKQLAANRGADNIIFYGRKPLEEMPMMYRTADAMLVTLEDKPYANMTIPGKIQSYMAAGKPIVGSVNGSSATFIQNNNIGYTCPAENGRALADLIKKLKTDELREIGKHARSVYLEKYSKKVFDQRLLSVLNEKRNNGV